MKKLLILCALAAMLATGAANARQGVTINGVTWATGNVGVRGKFMDRPTDYGLYYTFDEAQTACPIGWRTPTSEEFEVLCQSDNEWTTVEGVEGRKFGRGDKTIFLPAAGNRNNSAGSVSDTGTYGLYWSATASTAPYSYSLCFYGSSVAPEDYYNRGFGRSVRCVAE